jgi:hypothetical protein
MNKFCSDCEAQNSTHVRIVNSILIEDSSVVSSFAFDEKNIISYENLFSISDSSAAAHVVTAAFNADVDFDSSILLFDHASALTSRFHTIQNRMIANVRREHTQEKKNRKHYNSNRALYLKKKSRRVIQEIRSRCLYDDVFLLKTRAKND